MVSKKTSEEGAFAGAGWARENQRADPRWARQHRGRDGIDRIRASLNFHIRINRTGPNSSLYYVIPYRAIGIFRHRGLISFRLVPPPIRFPFFPPSTHPSLFSSSPSFPFLSLILVLSFRRGPKQSVAHSHHHGRPLLSSSGSLSILSFLHSICNILFIGHRLRCRRQSLPLHAPQMCGEGRFWKGIFLRRPSESPLPTEEFPQVRVVQHKQTRDLYALKYINKSKCVRMKAVANVIQERRLLEEVCPVLLPLSFILRTLTDRPSFCGQSAIRLPRRRELFFCFGSDAWR